MKQLYPLALFLLLLGGCSTKQSEVILLEAESFDKKGGWGIDLHYADSLNSLHYPGDEFYSWYRHPAIEPYEIPYRCLYSRNIDNLFMAGRCISVTHVALGTVRVMRTGGMMGEIVGMAASICKENEVNPRDVYENYLDELVQLFESGVPTN